MYAGAKATPTAASSNSTAAGMGQDEGPPSLSVSRSFSAGSPTNASSEPSASSVVTSSPSRESRERAEEVARKVVSADANYLPELW